MEDMCKNCGVCCRYIPVDVENGIILRDSPQLLTDEFKSMLLPVSALKLQSINELFAENVLNCNVQFFKCKYLINENICTNPNKPQECINFPSSPLAFVSNECGYYGSQFLKSEELKQKIRKMKEEILHYEALIISDYKNSRNYKKIIEQLKRFILKYSIYGSEDW